MRAPGLHGLRLGRECDAVDECRVPAIVVSATACMAAEATQGHSRLKCWLGGCLQDSSGSPAGRRSDKRVSLQRGVGCCWSDAAMAAGTPDAVQHATCKNCRLGQSEHRHSCRREETVADGALTPLLAARSRWCTKHHQLQQLY